MTGAKRATHFSCRRQYLPSKTTAYTANYASFQSPLTAICPTLDNAHELGFDDGSEWTRIYSAAQNPTLSKPPRRFKHNLNTPNLVKVACVSAAHALAAPAKITSSVIAPANISTTMAFYLTSLVQVHPQKSAIDG